VACVVFAMGRAAHSAPLRLQFSVRILFCMPSTIPGDAGHGPALLGKKNKILSAYIPQLLAE